MGKNMITVFSKPWKRSIPQLGEKLASLGVDGLELPVRPGYPVTAENMQVELPKAVAELKKFGLTVCSVASTKDEATIAACGAAGVPILRDAIAIDMTKGYLRSVDDHRRLFESLIPSLERNHVTLGIQNHCDHFVGSAIGLIHAIGDFAPHHVGAVLDVAHCGLDGEPEDMAIDIAWSHLIMVNLKNAFRMRTNGPETAARWRTWWTTGKHGFASWRNTAALLQAHNYAGPICLTAEYSEIPGGEAEDGIIPLIKEDIEYARSLFA